MACDLTQNISLDCRDAAGGIKRFAVAVLGTKNSETHSGGVITALTLDLGKQFYEYEVDPNRESVFAEEKINTNDANGTVFYEVDSSINLYKRTATKSNEIKLLAANRLMILMQDMNGTWWMQGFENGATLQASTAPTGKALGDFNGYTLNFKSKEVAPMYEVDEDIIEALLAPAVS